MDFPGKIFDTITGGIPGLVMNAIPDRVKKRALARIEEHNPLKIISANHDLPRATRLAWIDAAQEILKAAQTLAKEEEWQGQGKSIDAFHSVVFKKLFDVRDRAYDCCLQPIALRI